MNNRATKTSLLQNVSQTHTHTIFYVDSSEFTLFSMASSALDTQFSFSQRFFALCYLNNFYTKIIFLLTLSLYIANNEEIRKERKKKKSTKTQKKPKRRRKNSNMLAHTRTRSAIWPTHSLVPHKTIGFLCACNVYVLCAFETVDFDADFDWIEVCKTVEEQCNHYEWNEDIKIYMEFVIEFNPVK